MRNIEERETLRVSAIKKPKKQDKIMFWFLYGVSLLAIVFLTILIYAWITSPCATVDWMTVDITVHGAVKTQTTTEYVPVCIPQP